MSVNLGPREFVNFGRDVRFRAQHVYRPESEAEVLVLLDLHRGHRVRAVGSLHSWSQAPAESDVVLDLRRLNRLDIQPEPDGTSAMVTVGAGWRLRDLLTHLHARSAFTVPTLGAITRQRVAGVVSTATHGSGRHSFSHYADRLRVAAYDPKTGLACVKEYTGGQELLAARCALGCLGVILEVSFRAVPKYAASESVHRRATLDEIISDESEYPLQQFVLMPYLWTYYQYKRRVEPSLPNTRGERLKTWLYRWYKWLAVDLGFHAAIKGLSAVTEFVGWETPVRWFYKWAVPWTIVRCVRVTDESTHTLTIRHDLFCHTEMELFVPAKHIRDAVELLRELIDLAAGVRTELGDSSMAKLADAKLLDAVRGLTGTYTQHYPIVFRRVLPDDTLIAMTADATEPSYTVSLFTFQRPGPSWERFTALVATVFARLFDARLHWGKYFPLELKEYARLYPQLALFRALCQTADPAGAFRNEFVQRVLGFDPAPTPGDAHP